MKTCVQTGQISSESAIYTTEFLEKLNNLFDTLNSKNIYSKNPYQSALSEENPTSYQCLINAQVWSETLSKITNKGLTKPPSFNGLTWSINSILALYRKQKELGYPYILTSRLNSDVIENLFASYRQRGGYNRNPTVRTFRTTFRLNSKMNLIKPSVVSNCEPDNDSNLLSTIFKSTSVEQEMVSDSENSDDPLDPLIQNKSDDISDMIEQPLKTGERKYVTLQDCSEMYFAGYLIKKCLDKFNCSMCSEKLQIQDTEIDDARQLLIINKTYDSNLTYTKLKKPSKSITDFVSGALVILQKIIDNKPHAIKLREKISEEIKQNLFKNVITEDYHCYSHLEFLTNHLIYCKLFRFFNLQSKNIKGDRSKIVSKLNILQNA
jgi:hypothetical protein